MSIAKKRAASQCDDHECESDEPAIKVIKFSVQFSGQEVHDTYKKEGFSVARASRVFTEKLFEGKDICAESEKEKKHVEAKIKLKIKKFVDRVKAKGTSFRNSDVMRKPLILASDYNIFTRVEQREKSSRKTEEDEKDRKECVNFSTNIGHFGTCRAKRVPKSKSSQEDS